MDVFFLSVSGKIQYETSDLLIYHMRPISLIEAKTVWAIRTARAWDAYLLAIMGKTFTKQLPENSVFQPLQIVVVAYHQSWRRLALIIWEQVAWMEIVHRWFTFPGRWTIRRKNWANLKVAVLPQRLGSKAGIRYTAYYNVLDNSQNRCPRIRCLFLL